MNATYEQGLPIEGAFDFASIHIDAQAQINEALTFLPAVELSQFQHPQHNKPILFIACDRNYFFKHTIALIWSLVETQCQYAIHVHIFNPDFQIINNVAKSIQEQITPISLVFSYEQVNVENYTTPSVYFSCVRFCRLYQLSVVNPHNTIIMVDADVLFRKIPENLISLKEEQVKIGFIYSEYEPLWDCTGAGVTYYKPASVTQAFLSTVALVIIENIRKKTARWFLDQVALFVAHQKLKQADCFQFLSTQQYFNQKFDDDAVIWAVVNKLKTQKNRYNDYKQQLLAKYGDFRQIADSQFNELVQAKYGRMLYNKHDTYIGKSIKHHGTWCEHEIELLRQLIQQAQTVLDIGANIGTHTLPFCHFVGANGKVFAFEPQRIVYQTLVANMALNSITNAYCYHKAVGQKKGKIRVPIVDYTKSNNFGGLSLRKEHTEKSELVDLITVDSLQLDACNLIKMDVEGMERDILKGAKKTIQRFKPVMYLENHNDENRQLLITLARNFNYRLFWHGTENDPNMLCIPMKSPIQVQGLEEVR